MTGALTTADAPSGSGNDGPALEERAPETRSPGPRAWPYWLAVGVALIGLLVTAALALVSNHQYTSNEKRLLELRGRELGSLLAAAIPDTETPLTGAAALAEATNGNVQKFKRFVAPYAGAKPKHQFVSVSLWRLDAIKRGPLAVAGSPPDLRKSLPAAQAFFAQAARSPKMSVTGLMPPLQLRLGYAMTAAGQSASPFIVYAENPLPANRRSKFERNAAFSDLNYAIYLGRSVSKPSLLVTSVSNPPIQGRQSKLVLPFGSTFLTVVVAPRVPLSGTLPQRLPLIIAIVGVVLALAGGALTVRLIQRRRGAEDLAGRLEHAVTENQRLYAEQRNIAHTLQHALLPDELPKLVGAEASARFEPGERGVEIGGDWYDVLPMDDQRLLVVVGDVSGRGLRAATTMASLRYAIHAYAAQGDSPPTILTKLSKILSVSSSGQLATVLCALIDLPSRQVSMASAGHLPPLLLSDGRGEYLQSEIGLPIGVDQDASYDSLTVTVPPAATFLAFTDGLVERRGEALDRGLARLRQAASTNHIGLPELLNHLLTEMHHGPAEDDTAIVGLRWRD